MVNFCVHVHIATHLSVIVTVLDLKVSFLFSGVDSLFNKTNCDRSAITDMLGGKSGATDANMMQVHWM